MSDSVRLCAEQFEELVARVTTALEPSLDKDELGDRFGKKRRWVEYRIAEGMPHEFIDGKVMLKESLCRLWLSERGHIRPGGGEDPRRHLRALVDGATLDQSNTDANGAAPQPRPAPGHQEVGPDAKQAA